MSNKIKGLKDIAHIYKCFIFDMDGVFWRGNEAIPGKYKEFFSLILFILTFI